MTEPHYIDVTELLPEAWAGLGAAGPVRAFNPGILAEGEGWILAFRIVGPDSVRRIGICRLDRRFGVVSGSPLPWSDAVRFEAAAGYSERARSWFADPRLHRLGNRLFLSWNSGWHDPMNHQFVQELNPPTLQPRGRARELTLRGSRRPIEKNWTFFGDGPFFALYSLSPHRVMRFSLEGEGPIEFAPMEAEDWDGGPYAREFGLLRGGTPPQRVGADYFGIGHSVAGVPENYRYVAAAYRFSAETPFRLTAGPAAPLRLGGGIGAKRRHPPLNPAIAEVIYPCGAVHRDGQWTVSYGVNDERCALSVLTHAELLQSLREITNERPGPANAR